MLAVCSQWPLWWRVWCLTSRSKFFVAFASSWLSTWLSQQEPPQTLPVQKQKTERGNERKLIRLKIFSSFITNPSGGAHSSVDYSAYREDEETEVRRRWDYNVSRIKGVVLNEKYQWSAMRLLLLWLAVSELFGFLGWAKKDNCDATKAELKKHESSLVRAGRNLQVWIVGCNFTIKCNSVDGLWE